MSDLQPMWGEWWIPSDPDHRASGHLVFDESGSATLHVVGELEQIEPVERFKRILTSSPDTYPLVHGHCTGNKSVSLHRCRWYSGSISTTGGPSYAIINAELAVVGALTSPLEELQVEEIRCSTPHLPAWSELCGFDAQEVGRQFATFNRRRRKARLTHTRRSPIDVGSGGGFRLIVSHEIAPIPLSAGMTSVSVNEKHWLSLLFHERQTFSLASKELVIACNLISLAIGHLTRPTVTEVRLSPESRQSGKFDPTYARVVCVQSRVSERATAHNHEMLFTPLKLGRKRFGQILRRWVSMYGQLQPVLDLHFFMLGNSDPPVEEQFLAAIQVVEALDRRIHERLDLPQHKHSKRMDVITRHCPGEHRQWLADKLRFSNEVSLRKRLKALIQEHESVLGDRINRRKFMNQVVATRNFLTHFSPSATGYAREPSEFIEMSGKCRLISECVLLSKLRFSPEEIREMFNRSPLHRWLSKLHTS